MRAGSGGTRAGSSDTRAISGDTRASSGDTRAGFGGTRANPVRVGHCLKSGPGLSGPGLPLLETGPGRTGPGQKNDENSGPVRVWYIPAWSFHVTWSMEVHVKLNMELHGKRV